MAMNVEVKGNNALHRDRSGNTNTILFRQDTGSCKLAGECCHYRND